MRVRAFRCTHGSQARSQRVACAVSVRADMVRLWKLAIVVRTDLGMSKGKIAAQCAHAAVLAVTTAKQDATAAWLHHGQPKIVLRAASEHELMSLRDAGVRAGLPCAVVHDAGHTQVPAGSATVLAIGPATHEAVAAVTAHLKLL